MITSKFCGWSDPSSISFLDYNGKLCDDPTLMISPGVLHPCDIIIVKLSGHVLSKCPEYEGEYHHNGEYSQGRPVYPNNNKLLYQKDGEWRVGDNTGDRGKVQSKWDVVGGGAPNCPAMVSRWRYHWGSLDWTETSHVNISCSNIHQNK